MALREKPNSEAESFLTFLNDEMLERRTAFPAQITAVNIDSGDGALLSVDVLPLSKQTLSQDNTDELIYRDLPILANVPVVFPHSTVSGFSLTIPIQIGDQVLIVIADRSIDEWQTSGTTGRPVESTTPRAHDLTDAIAIIGISCDVKNVKNYSQDKIMIRNSDASIAVEVSNDDVVMKNGSITAVVASSDITLTNGSSIIGITSSEINIDADIVNINGINFSTHIHNIIAPDPGEPTTAPIP